MMPAPGSAKFSRSGPGEEITPSPTAATRSSKQQHRESEPGHAEAMLVMQRLGATEDHDEDERTTWRVRPQCAHAPASGFIGPRLAKRY